MKIRPETEHDKDAIYRIHEEAFPTTAEAELVNRLRLQADPIVSLVAETGHGKLVGHILFTPVTLEDHPNFQLMGLAPLAVTPERQGRKTGSHLVEAGLDRCREMDIGAVVVLGHPDYYPRFGFLPAIEFGIRSVFDVPPEVFMLIELLPGYLEDATGLLHYHPEFEKLGES